MKRVKNIVLEVVDCYPEGTGYILDCVPVDSEDYESDHVRINSLFPVFISEIIWIREDIYDILLNS